VNSIADRGLDGLRDIATKGLVLFLWIHVPFNLAVALILGNGWILPAVLATVLAGAATLAWRVAGSTALATRLVVAVAFIGMIGLLLEQMAGHPWQLDIHMYFFAALAVLAIYCDPLVLCFAAAATALHHLVLNFVLPAAVYPGGGDFGRVVLHAVIVVMETGVLIWLTYQLLVLFQRSAEKTAEASAPSSKPVPRRPSGSRRASSPMPSRRASRASSRPSPVPRPTCAEPPRGYR